VSYDVVVAGPPFLDLGFLGLPRLPRLGEEIDAPELVLGPGGAAITAIAASRLGLRSAVAWPVGRDLVGRWLADALETEGVDWVGPEAPTTPVTAIMALDGDRAMVTHRSSWTPDASHMPSARAFVTAASRAGVAPAGARVYVVADFAESQQRADSARTALSGCRALLINEDEALRLAGVADVEAAAIRLATSAGIGAVVVTRGARGAIAVEGSQHPVAVPAVGTESVDATGAGDVFAATYVWADLGGLGLTDRLALAALAAALAVAAPSGAGGAPQRAELERHARDHGLGLPPG